MYKIRLTGLVMGAATLCMMNVASLCMTACGDLGGAAQAHWWACHAAYTDPCGGKTGNPTVDLVFEFFEMPECLKLSSKNSGYGAIKNPDAAQKECIKRANKKLDDEHKGNALGEYRNITGCWDFGSYSDMVKKKDEYAAKVRAKKDSGTCDVSQIVYDVETNTYTLPGGCTYEELEVGDTLECAGPTTCEPHGEGIYKDACNLCVQSNCCPLNNSCYCGQTDSCPDTTLELNDCSCRLACENGNAPDGCASCAATFGPPEDDARVLNLSGCIKVKCPGECLLFLNY